MTAVRSQKTEDRGRKTDRSKQITEDETQKSENSVSQK